MCEPEPSVSLRGPVLVVGGALALGLALHVLAAVTGVLVALAIGLAVLAAAFVAVMRRLRRLSVVHWPAMQRQRVRRVARARRALPAPPRAIEPPKVITVTADMMVRARKPTV